VFVLAEVLHENESALLWCQRYFRYVGMPVYVLLPGIFALRGGRENKN
jgi:hypothetical protein